MTGAGDLQFRLRFERQDIIQGDYGARAGDWAPQFLRWAALQYLKGSEPVMAQRLTGIQPALIKVRYDSQTRTIEPSWRAVLMENNADVATFAIKTVADMDDIKRRFLTILAETGAADS